MVWSWYSVVWHGVVWYGMQVWYGTVWYGMVWYGMQVWYGTVRYGMVWYGMLWYGMVCNKVTNGATSKIVSTSIPTMLILCSCTMIQR